LAGAVHSGQAIFWQLGQIASPGIEQMAETGSTNLLMDEVQAVIAEGRAFASISANGIANSPGTSTVEVGVNMQYPLITLVSMLAPSPDWFVGVNSVSMLNVDDEFVQSLSVELKLYDSGTDSGFQFESANQETQPASPIDLLTSDSMDSDFIAGEPIVGRLFFERIQ